MENGDSLWRPLKREKPEEEEEDEYKLCYEHLDKQGETNVTIQSCSFSFPWRVTADLYVNACRHHLCYFLTKLVTIIIVVFIHNYKSLFMEDFCYFPIITFSFFI